MTRLCATVMLAIALLATMALTPGPFVGLAYADGGGE